MKLVGKSKVLRIYIGSLDKFQHKPMFEHIIFEAKKFGIAGATAFRGLLSYGANSMIHSSKIWELSADLPIMIEMIDEKQKIDDFTEYLDKSLTGHNFGGIVVSYEVDVIVYKAHENGKNK